MLVASTHCNIFGTLTSEVDSLEVNAWHLQEGLNDVFVAKVASLHNGSPPRNYCERLNFIVCLCYFKTTQLTLLKFTIKRSVVERQRSLHLGMAQA